MDTRISGIPPLPSTTCTRNAELPSLGVEEFHEIPAGLVPCADGLDEGRKLALFTDPHHQVPNLPEDFDRIFVGLLLRILQRRLEQ
ncbi:MAG TPA: hypothetical protein VNE63_11955 [Candidatus Acidoferrales bacterium]|nr:hypothetical protein [Candidatus Acidoferrales bacterium]